MRRLNLELSDEAYEHLESLRKRMGKSRAETLRSAVAALQKYEEIKSQGKKLVLLNKDGTIEGEIIV